MSTKTKVTAKLEQLSCPDCANMIERVAAAMVLTIPLPWQRPTSGSPWALPEPMPLSKQPTLPS